MYRQVILVQAFLACFLLKVVILKSAPIVQFDQIEWMNNSYLEEYHNISKFRVGKYNRTTFGILFEGEMFNDDVENTFIEGNIYYSKLNNNQWNLALGHLKKMTVCNFIEKYYKELMMEDLKNISNFPQYAPDDISCKFPKVKKNIIKIK